MEENKVYSDGNVEDIILNNLRAGNSYVTERLEDGAIFHNFAKCRENLLNWYPFKSNARLLEVGAGMGALTGLFCEKCACVVALEQAPKRAEIIRERYSDKGNLQVVCGDIFDESVEGVFDYVILAGVLEYAAISTGDFSAYDKMLCRISSLLKKDGKLLLAIENRFGLKYWCGAAEDHTGVPFDGISGYEQEGYTTRYNANGVRTFGKKELEIMLRQAGLEEQRWYYPLPDYKFPNAVFSDEKLPRMTDIQALKFTYSEESELVANEKKLYEYILSNDVFPFFANSYLVEASKGHLEEYHICYGSFKRDYKEKYRIITTLDSDGYYMKRSVGDASQSHLRDTVKFLKDLKDREINVIDAVVKGEKVISENVCALRADEAFAEYIKNGMLGECINMLKLLRQEVVKSSEIVLLKDEKNKIEETLALQPGEVVMGPVMEWGYTDMTFANSFYCDGKLLFFDQEWKIPKIPLNYILYRSINESCRNAQKDTVSVLWNYMGISGEQVEAYRQYETHMLEEMMDSVNCGVFDHKMYHEGLKALISGKRKYVDLFQEYEGYKVELSKKIELLQKEKDDEKERLIREYTKLREEEISRITKENTEKIYRLTKEKEELKKEFRDMEAELRQEILNKEGHIELLLPPEREYKKIINSKMFKVMRFLCRTYDILMFVPRIVIRNVLAFCRMMTHVNVQELKIAWGYVRNEGIRGAYHHLMRDYHQGEIKPIEVEVQNNIYEPIDRLESCAVLELPKCENPMVSIVIPAYNQFTFTYYCIDSIIKNSGDVTYEVILADDCSNDLTVNISKVVRNLVIARTETNQLFLRNCNQAAKKAKGKYVLFLNNDTQVQKNWLKPLVELCEKDQKIGIVGSKLVYSDGVLQEAGGIIWKDGSGWNYGRNDDAMKPEYNYVRDVDYISGAAIMLPKKIWDQLGGFDEYFAPAYCEDSDLAFRVREAGYRVVYQPLSVVVHFEGRSNGTDLNAGVKKYQVENSIKLRERWRDVLAGQYENAQCVFKARERGKDKKVILVIDHYVPQFDKDAGSKTTIQYLRMFVSKGYIVKFIGDNFFQHEPYTTVLQQMGIEVLYGSWYAEHWKEWILENKNYIDFVYLNRPHITIKYIDFIRQNTKIKCIYYGHDLHFLRLEREYRLNGDSAKKKEAEEWKGTELYIMRKADISYYPSYVEEKEIHKIDPAIPVKAITAYVYEQFTNNIPKDFTKREGIVFVGGFGHPPNADAVIWFAKEIYPRIREKVKTPFYIVGSNPTPEIEALNREDIVVKGFVSEEELAQLYDTCRLVVVPLRYGAGVKGKVVEALYYGTPIVTTSVGAEGIQDIEKWVQIADDAEGFADKVIQLYQDTEQLTQTVENYQKFVKERFSIEAVWNIVKEDFQ